MDEIAKTLGVPILVVAGGLSLIGALAKLLWNERTREMRERLTEKDKRIAELQAELSKTTAALLVALERQRGEHSRPL